MALILNILLFVLGLIGCVGEIRKWGKGILKYYTYLSNILGTLAAAFVSVALLQNPTGLPYSVYVFKYLATACLSLTFIVVILVLAPMEGKGGYKLQLIDGNLKFQHLLCPLLAIISFIVADPKPAPTALATFIAWLPTLIYAVVTVILNILKKLEGPYPFLEVYKQPWYASILWFMGIVGFQFLICMGLGAF